MPDDVFEALIAELRLESTWSEPPPGLRAGILAAVVKERDAAVEAPVVEAPVVEAPAMEAPVVEAPVVEAPVVDLSARRARRSRVVWGLGAAAAVAIAFAAGVLTSNGSTPPTPPGREFLAAGSPLAPAASAKVTVAKGGAGFSVQLELHSLPAAAQGSYYAAWLRGPDGLMSVGTFHGRNIGPPFKLWSGVDPARYPEFFVTLQVEGGPTEPSDRVVLRGTLR
jgi:hypothetical protein